MVRCMAVHLLTLGLIKLLSLSDSVMPVAFTCDPNFIESSSNIWRPADGLSLQISRHVKWQDA
jgi:hypothetical protein